MKNLTLRDVRAALRQAFPEHTICVHAEAWHHYHKHDTDSEILEYYASVQNGERCKATAGNPSLRHVFEEAMKMMGKPLPANPPDVTDEAEESTDDS